MKKNRKALTSLILASMLCLSSTAFASSDTYNGYGSELGGYVSVPFNSFTDVPSDFWAHDAIIRVADKGWFGGYPDGSFRPNSMVSRAEAMKVFVVSHSLAVSPVTSSSYPDVSTSDWFCPYIEAGKGILPVTTTMGQTPFKPNAPITREDTAYAVVKIMGYESQTTFADQSVLNMFSDPHTISEAIKPYMSVALQNGLISGFPDNTIRAQDPLSRAEFATILYRATMHGYN